MYVACRLSALMRRSFILRTAPKPDDALPFELLVISDALRDDVSAKPDQDIPKNSQEQYPYAIARKRSPSPVAQRITCHTCGQASVASYVFEEAGRLRGFTLAASRRKSEHKGMALQPRTLASIPLRSTLRPNPLGSRRHDDEHTASGAHDGNIPSQQTNESTIPSPGALLEHLIRGETFLSYTLGGSNTGE